MQRAHRFSTQLAVLATCGLLAGCSQRDSGVCSLAITPDGKTIAVATNNGYIAVHDVATKRRICQMSLAGQAGSRADVLAFAGNNDVLVSGDRLVKDHFLTVGGESRITFWNLPSGSTKRVFSNMGGKAIAVSPDRQQVAIAAGGPIFLFRIRAGEILQRTFDTNLEHISSLSFSADGQHLIGACLQYRVPDSSQWTIWDTRTGEQLSHAAIQTESMLFDATFTSDGSSVLFVGNKEKCLRYFDAQSGEQLREVAWERYRTLSVTADHRRMASCCPASGGVMLWDVDTGRKITTFGAKQHFSHAVISPDGSTVVAIRAGENNIDGIEFWHVGND